jgi:hypothetical protein
MLVWAIRRFTLDEALEEQGDTLAAQFGSRDGRLPDDFTTGDGRDIEVWRRVAP